MSLYRLELRLEGLPSTINSIGRKHWAVKVKEATTWKEHVRMASMGKTPLSPLKKAKIIYTRVSSTPLDCDGLVSSFKHVQDGLVYAGVLINDRWENIGMPEYRWVKGKAKSGYILVSVEELVI